MKHAKMADSPVERHTTLWRVLGVVSEILVTLAVVCAVYVIWQLWWTGVQAERTQAADRQQVSWADPAFQSDVRIAAAQEGDAPVQPETAGYGELVAQVYVPRFGQTWERNVVEGTDSTQLARHGLGHYTTSQMPGQLGNFAVAGHRDGYGQPLGDIDKLQEGDAVVVRTQDYWYVYTYTSHKIVLPTDTSVISPVPEQPTKKADKRRITLTSCEPKYSTPTHRWIAWGELKYWAKVSDGIPQELAATDSTGKVKFAANPSSHISLPARIGSLKPWILGALAVWLVLFMAAAVAWRWPKLTRIRDGIDLKPDTSMYGGLSRLMPGVLPIRILLLALLLFAATASLFEWVFPWAATNIPILQQMSGYSALE